ncbi:aminotransferase A [Gorillibacterium massiliense]|uniref:aminotransferase A n=1 Tax=Gorillibacterium massiliense TaxID=1280390 RepID=UPI0004B0FAE7|nr:aminotransferase A [Gorillibacterium massiliense]
MEHLLNERVRGIEISGIRKVSNRVAQIPGALTLTLGQPDFPTPTHIKEAAKRAIDSGQTGYTANAGLLELRRAAAAFVETKYGLSYNPETEVIVTIGAAEALEIALQTLITPGDEVILPGPIYPGYEPIIRMCGGVPVYVDTRETDFLLTAEGLSEKLTNKTRAVIIGSPSNPTGRVMSYENMAAIAALLKDRQIFVVSDEIYSELIYDGAHVSAAAFPELREKTVIINGLSKSHSMTGWRIGFTFAPAYMTQHMLKVHQYHATCASSVSQFAAIEALTMGVDDAEPMRVEYRRRRDYAAERLTAMGFGLIKPEGAFYLFPSIRPFGLSSQEFSSRLLDEEKVAVVPGDAFSDYGEGYIRISYACAMDVLEEALNRVESFVGKIR